MRYQSTRGTAEARKTFEEALLATYADDGGLFVPVELPAIVPSKFDLWQDMSFPQVCAEILHLFTDIALEDLNKMTTIAFSGFNGGQDPLPILRIEEDDAPFLLLDLSLGPTMAFKDVGQQMCGQLLNYVLGKQNRTANVMVETSGDTGPAAIAAVRHCPNVNIYCLYPKGRVSRIQELQMTTVIERNVFVYQTEGDSDLQASALKDIFADREFVQKHNVCSVNSINWFRIATQSSYYVWLYIRLKYHGDNYGVSLEGKPLRVVIPSGALGNGMGAFVAKLMGTPIERIMCATNQNDIVHRTISVGDLSLHQNVATVSPAMDIQFAYNIERMLFYVSNKDCSLVRETMNAVDNNFQHPDNPQSVQLSAQVVNAIQQVFSSIAVSDAQTLSTMKSFYEHHGICLCPHSAVGVFVAEDSTFPDARGSTTVCVLTAHPRKFVETVEQALGYLPQDLSGPRELESLPSKFEVLPLRTPQWREEWIARLKSDVTTNDGKK